MNTVTQTLAQYEATQVEGRSKWCPRIGTYKILSTYEGNCLGKPALMAKTRWKSTGQISYSDLTFEIQLESLKLNLCSNQTALNADQIVGREIDIEEAFVSPLNGSLQLKWSLITNADDLNKLMAEGGNISILIDDDFEDMDDEMFYDYE